VDPRADLDTEATGRILCICRGSNLDHPVVQCTWATRLLIVSNLFNSLFPSDHRKVMKDREHTLVWNFLLLHCVLYRVQHMRWHVDHIWWSHGDVSYTPPQTTVQTRTWLRTCRSVLQPFIASLWNSLFLTTCFISPPHNLKGTTRGWGSLRRSSIHCITGPRNRAWRRGNGPTLEFIHLVPPAAVFIQSPLRSDRTRLRITFGCVSQ
jgi:hypothetical protein